MKPSLSQLKRLVGNPDAYAIQQDDGSYRPIRKTDGGTGEPIHWHNALKAHLAGGWTIGTYVITGDKAHTLVFDIDSDTTSIEEADRIVSALSDLGIPEYAWGDRK